MTRCEQHRPQLVAHVRDQLGGLEERALAAHLGICAACAALRARIAAGMGAARAWQPEPDTDKLAELVARLEPYVQPMRRAPSPWRPVAFGALAAATVAVALMVVVARLPERTPVAPAPATPPLAAPLLPVAPAIERAALSAHVRVVRGGGWDGVVSGDRELLVRASRGFCVFQFTGGDGRKLRIESPGAVVEVVGTRFYVEARGDRTLVGVAEGKVQVSAGDSWLLGAGESGSFGQDGRRVAGASEAAGWLDDAYLLESEARLPSRRAAARRLRSKKQVERLVTPALDANAGAEALRELQRAEGLIDRGDVEAGAAAYHGVVDDPRPGLDTYRDLARYELARLDGFHHGRIEQARQALSQLAASAGGEVRLQAALALCELDLKAEPCRSRACLVALAGGPDFELGGEAEQLLDQWRLRGAQCDLVDRRGR